MNIVICEDDLNHMKYIKDCVEDTICINSLKCKLALCTSSTTKIMDYIQQNKIITLYFLDIDLNSNIDGFNIATKIRENDWHSFIVFITGLKDKANLTFEYKLEILDYIMKGQNNLSNKIKDCILLACSREDKENSGGNLITLSNKYSKICLNKNDIFFIESIKHTHKVIYHYENGIFEMRGNLKDISNDLGESFIRCNKSIIVNKSKIASVNSTNKTILLNNNITCYYSNNFGKDDILWLLYWIALLNLLELP